MHTKTLLLGFTIGAAFGAVALVSQAIGLAYLTPPSPAQYTLTARPWDSTNVYVLDHGLTAEDCTYDLETFAPEISPMVELEPGNWIDREAVQMACGLDGDI